MTKITAIIPAAGRGSRLLPFPCPKELFPIGYQDYPVGERMEKRPKVVSQYLVDNLVQAGAENMFIIVGADKWDIMRYYGDGSRFKTNMGYLYQEQLTGVPGAIDLARPWVGDDTILFGMPDTIIEPADCFAQLRTHHEANQGDLVLALFPTDNPSKFGMVDIGEDGVVRTTIDKPQQTDLRWMWGAACWSPAFTRLLGAFLMERPYAGKEIVLGDVFNHAINVGLRVHGVMFEAGQYIDIGTANELDQALKMFHL
jgi:glucose-1-phosphate thymidylyltransferase